MTMRYEMETPKHFSATAKSNLFYSSVSLSRSARKETGSSGENSQPRQTRIGEVAQAREARRSVGCHRRAPRQEIESKGCRRSADEDHQDAGNQAFARERMRPA